MRVLFIRLAGTIDVVNTLPAICAFRRDRPDAWIVYATHSDANVDIIRGCRAVNECLVIPDLQGEVEEEEPEDEPDNLSNKGKKLFSSLKNTAKKTIAGAKTSAELVKHLHSMELDAVIDLEVSVRSALVARNSGAGLVFGFRSENASNRSAALAYGQAPYVNPTAPDYQKYNVLIAKSLGTSTLGAPTWEIPGRRPDVRSQVIQAIPTGLISPDYWTGVLTSLAQHGLEFRVIDCPLTNQDTLARIVREMGLDESTVQRVPEKICERLVDNGGPVVADAAAAYLSVAAGLDTMAVGEQASSPLIAPAGTFFYSYPGPKDLPYPETFVDLVIEMTKRQAEGPALAAPQPPAIEAQAEPLPPESGLDEAPPPSAAPEEGRRQPLVFKKTDG